METEAATINVTLNFLYQLIGQKEVENAVLRERLVALQGEVSEVKSVMATMMHDAEGDGGNVAESRQDLAG